MTASHTGPIDPDCSPFQEKDGRHPRPDNPQPEARKSESRGNRLKISRYAGLLLYLLSTEDPRIRESVSDLRKEWILNLLGRLSEDILLKAHSFYLKIETDPRVRNSLKKEIRRELHSFRAPPEVSRPEVRRIGVGYRDKGALRPLHLKREVGEESFWFEDVSLWTFSLPNGQEFITAEEVLSSGTSPDTFELVNQQVRLMASLATLAPYLL